MKKIILAICLAFLSLGAFASSSSLNLATDVAKRSTSNSNKLTQFFVTAYTYTSSCGVVWSVTSPDDAPIEAHQRAWEAMENACGTNIAKIEVPY